MFKWNQKLNDHLIIFLLLIAGGATISGCSHGALNQGEDACSAMRRSDPTAASLVCGGTSSSASKIGAPKTSIGSRTLMNPAFIPTGKSALGLETMLHYLKKPEKTLYSPSFSIIKGFGRAGAGVTTNTANTFYGNDIMQRAYRRPRVDNFHEAEDPKRSYIPSFNAGTAFSIMPNGSKVNVILGGGIKYNNITDTFGPSLGFGVGRGRISFSFSLSKEKVSNDHPATYFGAAGISLQLPYLQFDYNILKNWGTFELNPVHIFTTTLSIRHLIIFGAVRRLNFLKNSYSEALEVQQYHAGIQYQFHPKLALGWSYNYIPGTNALIGQFFL